MKNFKLISLFLVILMSVNAQDMSMQDVEIDESKPSNWFVEFGVGTQMLFASDVAEMGFGERQSLALSLSFGKWINPYFGLRAQYNGYNLDSYTTYNGYFVSQGEYDIRYMNLHIDAIFSLQPLFNEGSKWDIQPSIGLGYMRIFDYGEVPKEGVMTHNFGMLFKYEISEKIDFNVALSAAGMPDMFESQTKGRSAEWIMGLTGGFTFHLGQRGFKKKMAPPTYITKEVPVVEYEYITKIDTVYKESAMKDSPKEEMYDDSKLSFVLGSVLFDTNSSKADKSQEIQIENIAKFLNENPERTVQLAGYADKETGSSTYNRNLSQKRVDYVKSTLENKYGVDPKQVDVVALGAEDQPYSYNDNNRVVVATLKATK